MYKELDTYAELLFCSLHLLLFRRSPCRRRRSFVRSLMTEDSSKDKTNRCLFFIRVIFVFIYLIGHFYLSYIDKKKDYESYLLLRARRPLALQCKLVKKILMRCPFLEDNTASPGACTVVFQPCSFLLP